MWHLKAEWVAPFVESVGSYSESQTWLYTCWSLALCSSESWKTVDMPNPMLNGKSSREGTSEAHGYKVLGSQITACKFIIHYPENSNCSFPCTECSAYVFPEYSREHPPRHPPFWEHSPCFTHLFWSQLLYTSLVLKPVKLPTIWCLPLWIPALVLLKFDLDLNNIIRIFMILGK